MIGWKYFCKRTFLNTAVFLIISPRYEVVKEFAKDVYSGVSLVVSNEKYEKFPLQKHVSADEKKAGFTIVQYAVDISGVA
jgi:hypothetical protein